MRVCLLTLAVIVAACGSTPAAPTPPTPAAELRLVPGDVTFTELTYKGWAYTGRVENTGRGCASRVSATTIFRDPAGTETARSEWQLDAARVIRPAEIAPFADCCLPFHAETATTTASVTFRWTDVSCP